MRAAAAFLLVSLALLSWEFIPHVSRLVDALAAETQVRSAAVATTLKSATQTARDSDELVKLIKLRVPATLDNLDTAATSLNTTIVAAYSVTSQVAAALPDYLDCDHNVDCFFNRYQGTMHDLEKTMGDARATMATIKAATPETVALVTDMEKLAVKNEANAERVTAAAAAVAERIGKPQSVGGKIWETIKLLPGILRLLL